LLGTRGERERESKKKKKKKILIFLFWVQDESGDGDGKQNGRERRADRERGVVGRGNASLEEILLGGNKGGQIVKNGRGRVEERGEPGMAASVQTGHWNPKTRYGTKPDDKGASDPMHT
jgi:hypothetical protein